MSAWLCTQKHIAALATALADLGHGPHSTGETLLRANEVSLRARYAERAPSYWPDLTAPFSYSGPIRDGGPAWLLKLVDCYSYQSCAADSWQGSEAKRLCDEIERAILGADEGETPDEAEPFLDVIRGSAEYKRAPWGI